MKRNNVCSLLILLFVIAASIIGCSDKTQNKLDYPVKIMLSENELLSVNGESSVFVTVGNNVEFDVDIPDGMTVSDLSSGAYFEDGKIKIDNVYFPVTVKYTVREAEYYTFTTKATRYGGVSKAENITVCEHDKITLKAYPNDNAFFAGWSYDKPLSEGGEFISSLNELVFKLTKNCKIYGNFINEDAVLIKYNTNGGFVSGSEKTEYINVIEDDYHIYANTLPDTGIFIKEGSVLIGYNSKPDGSGDFFGLGWNITTEENITELYCMWSTAEPSENFEYISSNKNIKITEYLGNEKTVTIPEYIDGKKLP